MNLLTHCICCMFLVFGIAQADTFFVAPDGADEPGSGTRDKPWASLAYACDQVPEGDHAISLAPGDYVATRTAFPKSGVTIVGRKPYGKDRTLIQASPDWPLGDAPVDALENEYLIAFTKGSHIKIHSLALASAPEHRINGAIRCFRSEDIVLKNLHLREFRWAGIHAEVCQRVSIQECNLHNASTDRSKYWGGLIRTRYLNDSDIGHNRITSDTGGGYGYKGGGHKRMRFHHNFVDVKGGFSFESPHENEHGVEIDHNYMTGCISIPKGVQSPDPNKLGFPHTFHIHHNYLTHSYTIEGPRNHLRVNHNWIHVEKPNGRIYTQHGGTNNGPIWIHHNVIENVDRALVWMNRGLAENIHVFNNTIFCADAGRRRGNLLGAWGEDRLHNWTFHNNLVIAAWTQSRSLYRTERGVPSKISATHNLFLNVDSPPPGNFSSQDPGLNRLGAKPGPFYVPAAADSFVVDRGIDQGEPFQGRAPDIGAFEWGQDPWTLEGIPQPRS